MIKFILIILDGFGLRAEKEGNAAALADTPQLDRLLNECPMVPIETSGKYVGLPDGIMGNSEVGHMNIGAGRIVKQDLVRINEAIQSNELKLNKNLQSLFDFVLKNSSTLHLMGLVSDAGVHCHMDHFKYIIQAAKEAGVRDIAVHAFTDGRDTDPNSGLGYLTDLSHYLKKSGIGKVASICGRYYVMDRDKRWDRNKIAYDLFVNGVGERYPSLNDAVYDSYKNGITDEFIKPKIIGDPNNVKNRDGVLTMNFRADRMRQITEAFIDPDFSHYDVNTLEILYTSMTRYREGFKFPVLFSPEKLTKLFPEILANNNFRQLRIAETEKYAHVTYFFNGGDENLFNGEDRILIPSPKVATYDLQPEMSAHEVTENCLNAIKSDKYEAIIINYANPDMVGHTGNLNAGIRAIETIDECLGKVIPAVKEKGGSVFLTSDHGNLEMMVNPETGGIHTAHTTLPVPLVLDSPNETLKLLRKGKLADVAPTILDFLNISIPGEMTGISLLLKNGS